MVGLVKQAGFWNVGEACSTTWPSVQCTRKLTIYIIDLFLWEGELMVDSAPLLEWTVGVNPLLVDTKWWHLLRVCFWCMVKSSLPLGRMIQMSKLPWQGWESSHRGDLGIPVARAARPKKVLPSLSSWRTVLVDIAICTWGAASPKWYEQKLGNYVPLINHISTRWRLCICLNNHMITSALAEWQPLSTEAEMRIRSRCYFVHVPSEIFTCSSPLAKLRLSNSGRICTLNEQCRVV